MIFFKKKKYSVQFYVCVFVLVGKNEHCYPVQEKSEREREKDTWLKQQFTYFLLSRKTNDWYDNIIKTFFVC